MRLIVIGDLHGCLEELNELLELMSPARGDIVTCVGDFLTKGPRTTECLDLWRERAWDAVLGNNDAEVVRVIRGEHPEPKQSIEAEARRLESRPDLIAYLDALPLALDYRELDAAVVHGGVLPHSTFSEGVDPQGLLTLRDVVRDGDGWRAATDSDPEESRMFWGNVWSGDRFVVYGHTPRPEVVRHPRAMGIDTGCVYGWSLSAAIRSEDETWSALSVPARRVWAER